MKKNKYLSPVTDVVSLNLLSTTMAEGLNDDNNSLNRTYPTLDPDNPDHAKPTTGDWDWSWDWDMDDDSGNEDFLRGSVE